jgi:hypothetical protein
MESLIADIFPSFKILNSFWEKILIDSFGDFNDDVLYYNYDLTLCSYEVFFSWFWNLFSPIAEEYRLSFFIWLLFSADILPRDLISIFRSFLLLKICYWLASGFCCWFIFFLLSYFSFFSIFSTYYDILGILYLLILPLNWFYCYEDEEEWKRADKFLRLYLSGEHEKSPSSFAFN